MSEPKTEPQTPEADNLLVVFTADDHENPQNWPSRKKWAVTNVLSATGFNRILVSTIMAPALGHIAQELDMTSTQAAMSLSIYLLATAFGPLIIGPLSEVYGRQSVLHASNLWFLIWNIACGFATTKELLIAARFLAGFGASSIYALAGGVLGDVWSPNQRGRSLAMYLLIPLLGAAVGPIVGGFMTGRTTWRWMFWSTSMFQAVMMVFSLTTFRETYSPVILKRRAQRLREATGARYETLEERLLDEKPVLSIVARALTRPIRLLTIHPIIQIVSVISAFNYGILYIVLSSFAEIWVKQYAQSVEISGLHYIACAMGEIVGSQVGAFLMDKLYARAAHESQGDPAPEARIPLSLPGAVLEYSGLILYGWMAQYAFHWATVDTGIFLTTFGMQILGMPLQAFVIDSYPEHASSALAASQFLKSLTAFLFPLFAPTMYAALGYGWGNSTVALIGMTLGVPAPLLLLYFGARLRGRSGPTL